MSPLFTSTLAFLQSSPWIDTQDDEKQDPARVNSVQMCSYRNGEKSQVGIGEARLDADDRTVTVVQSGAYFWSRVGLHKTFRVYEGSQDALLSAIGALSY